MPNTPALVQTGATVIAPGSSILAGDKELIQGLFRTIGICEVGSEEQLDAVTGLSGSGPAYVSHYSLFQPRYRDGARHGGVMPDLSCKFFDFLAGFFNEKFRQIDWR